MRTRRTSHDELAAIAHRRLELLSAELAGVAPSGVELPEVRAVPELSEMPDEAASPAPASRQGPTSPARGRHARRPVGLPARCGAWVHDRLPPTLQGRVRLTAGHLSVVALLVAGALAVTSWWVVRANGSATVVPAATWANGSDPSGAPAPLVTPALAPSAPAAAGRPVSAQPASGRVVVDVAGKVRRPGIATLPVGSRVVDALEAAGGARRGVDLTSLNLARLLVDGEQIIVGMPPPQGVAAVAASSGTAPMDTGSLVNVNTAGQTELEELPGVGPVTAEAIVAWRTDHGSFTSVDELLEVSGIGEATLAEIAPFVTL